MKKLLVVSAVVIAVLTASGCGSQTPVSISSPSAPSASPSTTYAPLVLAPPSDTVSTQTSATPEQTAMSPTAPRAASTAVFKITDQDGYQANLTIGWHKLLPVALTDLPPTCVSALGDFDPSQYALKAVLITLSAEYPTVNGFSWPKENVIRLDIKYKDSSLNYRNGSACSSGDDATYGTPVPAVGDQPFEMYSVYMTKMTPDNPKGEIKVDLTQLTVSTNDNRYKQCTVTGAENLTANSFFACAVSDPL